jgi:hypothetical protein
MLRETAAKDIVSLFNKTATAEYARRGKQRRILISVQPRQASLNVLLQFSILYTVTIYVMILHEFVSYSSNNANNDFLLLL